jgi:hypothetical protein
LGERSVDYALSFEIGEALETGSMGTDELCDLLSEHRISHVFLGRRGGVLNSETLAAVPCAQKIYDHDGVVIHTIEH